MFPIFLEQFIMSLFQSLQNQLTQQQDMPFVEFMQQALYAPQWGYYSSGLPKLGKAGDFITGPELTPLFGQCLANQCQQILSNLDQPIILEYGAGSGRLCVTLLKQLESLHCLPEQYFILELSAHLRHCQQTLIAEQLPHLMDKVSWLAQWPDQSFHGIILANEVLDAMPVHRFLWEEDVILESFVRLNAQQQLEEFFKPSANQRLLTHVKSKLPELKSPYLSEVNLFIDDWIQQNNACLDRGAMLLIDYGFPRHEYYHPDRHQGTLMCHYQHHTHPNPLLHVGEQDITAHVDFTHVAEAAHQSGFHVAGYTNQASFLLANGLLSLLDLQDEKAMMETKQAIKQLTHPHEMGELFKVIALTKQIDFPLQGFLLHDKRASL